MGNKENELRRIISRFQAVLDSFPFDIWCKDLEGRYLLVNKNFEEYAGKSKEEILGKKDHDLYPKEEADAYVASDRSTLNGKTGYNEVDLHNGKYKEEFKQLFLDEAGEPVGTVGFSRDITDRKLLYDALEESERSKSTLLSNLPGVAYRCECKDSKWRMTFVSEGCYNLTGYKPEELMEDGGRTYFDLIEPEYLTSLIWKWREDIACGRISTDEYPIQTAAGQRKWVWQQSRLVYGPGRKVIASEGLIIDINDNKLAEQALKQSEERFRAIFEKSQIGIGIYDSVTGNAYHVNDRLVQILGRTKEEILSQNWLEYSYADDILENLRQIKLLNQGAIDSFSLDKRFVKSDGTLIWTNLIITPFPLEGAENPCHLCMVNDITAQKEAEEQTRYLNYHDQLTGLYNRRFYDEALKRLDTEDNLPISLIMADVNGLKLTNDAFGHLTGDQLLIKIAEIIKRECRPDDIAARTGGDEFILLLPGTGSPQAEQIMKQIAAEVQKQKENGFICSISFGTGTKRLPSEEMKKIYMLAEDRMYRDKLTESRSMRNEMIEIIRETLYQKNEREQLHCERVSALCESIGTALGLSHSEIMELKTAGLLHDIGKIGIDLKLLNKSEKLTKEEREDIQRHPEIGYHILSSVNEFASIAEYVLCHHERVDGEGYPRKLKESEIPFQSKIISIADCYDAMTSHRLYKGTMTKDEAIEEIKKNMGSQFDREIATVFVEKVLSGDL